MQLREIALANLAEALKGLAEFRKIPCPGVTITPSELISFEDVYNQSCSGKSPPPSIGRLIELMSTIAEKIAEENVDEEDLRKAVEVLQDEYANFWRTSCIVMLR